MACGKANLAGIFRDNFITNMKKARYAILILLVLLIALTTTLFLASSFLDYNAPVNSDNIVVEGWLQACELEQIKEKCQNINELIVVGNEFQQPKNTTCRLLDYFQKQVSKEKPGKGMWLYANSTLIFNPELLTFKEAGDTSQIVVRARGTKANGRFAHFNLIVNGEFYDDSFTAGETTDYIYNVKTGNTGLKTVGVRFDNDCRLRKEDRNLFILSIKVNGRQIFANKNTSLVTTTETRFTTGFTSKGKATLNYLKALNVKAKSYRTVSFRFARENQTLAAADSFRKWIATTRLRNFNIVSGGIHSRRSLVTYEKDFGDDYNIGVINLESARYNKRNWWKSPGGWLAISDELFSYIVNRIVIK